MEDILQKLHGYKYFSTLDQSSGYWNIEVHPDSVHLLTFNTPFGRYAYKRLPFGLVSSQDVFQRTVDETFGDIPNVYCIADDILIAARTREEHDMAVNRVIQRCRDSGFRLLRPHPNKGRIKTRCKEDPRDKAVGSAKEQAGATVTAKNVQLPGKVCTQSGCHENSH